MKQWLFSYKIAGQRRKIGIGSYPDVSLAAARTAAAKYRDLIKAGITPSGDRHKAHAESAAPAIPRTVADLFEKWRELYLSSEHADRGAAAAAAFARRVEPVIGRVKLLDVRKMHVLHVIDPIKAEGKKRTAAGVFSALRQMFRWGIGRDYIAADPTMGLSKRDLALSNPRPRDRHLSEGEIADLAARLRTTHRGGPEGREVELPALGGVNYPDRPASTMLAGEGGERLGV